ncbi:MAG: exo-alpha-sialidase, partial [Elusimicrobia bacterium]|nr:exo-alpha-sialidase [Elusimicrobiota bacterium]
MTKKRFIACFVLAVLFCGPALSSPEGWTKDMRIAFAKNSLSAWHGGGKCIRVRANIIYIVGNGKLEEGAKSAIYLWKSKDNGRTWSEPFRVSNSSGCDCPALYIYQNRMNVIWEDERDGDESEI